MEIEIINSSVESSFLVVNLLISLSRKKKNTCTIVFRVITKATVILAVLNVRLDGGFVQDA